MILQSKMLKVSFIESTASHGMQFQSNTSDFMMSPPKTVLPLLCSHAEQAFSPLATGWTIKNRENIKQASSSHPFKVIGQNLEQKRA